MMANTSSQALRDLLVETKDGDWGKESPAGGFVPYRVVRGTDFPSVRLGDTSSVPIRYLSESTVHRRTLKPNDILIETAGGSPSRPTGRSLLITAKLLSSLDLPATCASFARFLRVDHRKADPRYVYWYLQYLYETGQMEAHQVQHTGVARFQYTRFAETQQIPLPSPDDQHAIALILGTLDDKIELNRRMNETLETMARALFKSWFVDFDPVRAKMEGRWRKDESLPGLPEHLYELFPDRLVDSELGEIPEGWEVAPLDSVLVLQRGFDLPSTMRTPGAYPVLAASGPSGTHNEFMVRGPGVTTGRSGVLGRVFYVNEDFWPLNTSLWVKEFRHSRPAYAFHLLQGLDFALFNAGSAVPTLNRNHVHNLPTLLPPMKLIDAFERVANESLQRQKLNDHQSNTLASLRDTLLPRLISGELRLRDAERKMGKQI